MVDLGSLRCCTLGTGVENRSAGLAMAGTWWELPPGVVEQRGGGVQRAALEDPLAEGIRRAGGLRPDMAGSDHLAYFAGEPCCPLRIDRAVWRLPVSGRQP